MTRPHHAPYRGRAGGFRLSVKAADTADDAGSTPAPGSQRHDRPLRLTQGWDGTTFRWSSTEGGRMSASKAVEEARLLVGAIQTRDAETSRLYLWRLADLSA